MKIIDLSQQGSILNQYVAEMRDVNVQNDRMRFRRNIERIGMLEAVEISKTLSYSQKFVSTPLANATVNTHDDQLVVGTIFRAGLPMHQGVLEIFDHADNAFVSAYRYYKDKEHKEVDVRLEYIAAPELNDKTLILCDPMLATGESFELAMGALLRMGTPKHIHLACIIASQYGVDHMVELYGKEKNVTLWCGAIDPVLNDHKYIIPGLGDAGDLAYGHKISLK